MRCWIWALVLVPLLFFACGSEKVRNLELELVAEPELLDFGTVPLGTERSLGVTLRNLGEADAIASLAIADADFELETQQIEIARAGSAVVPLAFRPTAGGPVASELVVSIGREELRVPLVGVGSDRRLEAPQSLDFGDVRVGELGVGELVVRSLAAEELDVALTIEGSAFTGPSSITIAAQGEKRVPLQFRPTARGKSVGSLVLRACNSCETIQVVLTGNGTGEALSIAPAHLEFNAVPLRTRVVRTAVVRSVGEYAVENARVRLEGNSQFHAQLDTISLDAGAELELPVEFLPTAEGPVSGWLKIESADGILLTEMGLGGKGGAAEFVLEPETVDFGVQPVGRLAHRTLRVRNLSPTPTTRITGVSIEGAQRARFTAVAAAALPSSPNATDPLAVELTFSGPAAGTYAAELVLRTDDPWQLPIRVPLVAEAIVPPSCTLTARPSPVDFGTLAPGGVHARYLTLSNPGSERCLLWGITLVGNSSGFFTLAEQPDDTVFLDPGAFVRLRVDFDASSTGAVPFTARVRFFSAAFGSLPTETPVSAWVRPTGVTLDPGLLDYGDVPVGRAVVRALTLTNESDENYWFELPVLTPQSAPAFSLYPGDIVPAMLEPHARASFRLIYAPSDEGPAIARVLVDGSDSRANPLPAPLSADAWGLGTTCGAGCDWPTATCPASVDAVVGQAVQITGGGTAPAGGTVRCAWDIGARPEGSNPNLDDPQRCAVNLTTTNVGTYDLRLVSTAPDGRGATCHTIVNARPPAGLWVEMTWDQPVQFEADLMHPSSGPPDARSSWVTTSGYLCSSLLGFRSDWDEPGPADDPHSWAPTILPNFPPILLWVDEPSTAHPYWIGNAWYDTYDTPFIPPVVNVTTSVYCGGELTQQIQSQLEHRGHRRVVGSVVFVPGGPCQFTPVNYSFAN